MMKRNNDKKNIYYDEFLFPRKKADLTPSDYLFEAMIYLHENKILLESFLTLLKITREKGDQLILTVDRDFFCLNWRYLDNEKKIRSKTISHWTSVCQFKNLSYPEFEKRLIEMFYEYQKKNRK